MVGRRDQCCAIIALGESSRLLIYGRMLLLSLALLTASVSQAQVEVVFAPSEWAHEYATRTYRQIWGEYGQRIVRALEARTCMPFSETSVSATVAEAVSHSGGPEHPMRLRASYVREIKESTLVHELGHRHLWQLEERLDDVDGHMTLYLILERVWADVWGEKFAEDRVRSESAWDEDYADAWGWARALESAERADLWGQLLDMNGLDRCDGVLSDSTVRR
jgi:hypothetical protein